MTSISDRTPVVLMTFLLLTTSACSDSAATLTDPEPSPHEALTGVWSATTYGSETIPFSDPLAGDCLETVTEVGAEFKLDQTYHMLMRVREECETHGSTAELVLMWHGTWVADEATIEANETRWAFYENGVRLFEEPSHDSTTWHYQVSGIELTLAEVSAYGGPSFVIEFQRGAVAFP